MNPVHVHDCNLCRYLGTVFSGTDQLDGYYCSSSGGGSVILRFASVGSAYWSMPLELLDPNAEVARLGKRNAGYFGNYIIADFLLRKAGLRE